MCSSDLSNGDRTVINSIIYGNGKIYGSPNIELFANDTESGILSISYSDIEGGQDSVNVQTGTLNWGDGNIDVDPMFVDTANGDYTLQMDSPLIDAGHPDSTDADGTIADIGAYYYEDRKSTRLNFSHVLIS